jgi:hypothetical protein
LYFAFFVPGEMSPGADAAQIARYYEGRGQSGLVLMYALIGLAGIALLWFGGSLWTSLRRREPGSARLSAIAFAGVIASATLFLAGGAALLAPFTLVVVEFKPVEPILDEAMSVVGFTAMNFGLLAGAVTVIATSLVALRWNALPAWFAWLGFVVAVALMLNILYFFGLFIWVGWVFLASILLTRPANRAELEDRSATGPPTSAAVPGL